MKKRLHIYKMYNNKILLYVHILFEIWFDIVIRNCSAYAVHLAVSNTKLFYEIQHFITVLYILHNMYNIL